MCSVKKQKLNRVFARCWFQCVQVWWKCQAIVQATERWNAKLFGQNALRCVVDMCIRSTERKEQLCLHACVFWTGMFTSESANCRFHRKIADFCAQRLCCAPTLLPNDAANVWKLREGGKLADVSASKRACALVSAARCESRFRPCNHGACMRIAMATHDRPADVTAESPDVSDRRQQSEGHGLTCQSTPM